MESYQRLELEFGKFAGYSEINTVVCSSGTAALHLAFEALQLQKGSEVILSDFNMIACARAVTLAGLKPVFADCTDRLVIDPEQIEDCCRAIDTPRGRRWRMESDSTPKAILATHIYGRSCDMSAITDLAAKYDLKVIEDLAEAHGLSPHPNTDAACWSFYKNKIIAGEEGGAVCFRDEKLAKRARSLRSLGFTDAHDYQHIPGGHNYRLANCLAEKILDGISVYKIDVYYSRRRQIETWYDTYCPNEWRMPYRDAVWVYDLRIPGMMKEEQDDIVNTLREKGIEARHGFHPMHKQEEYLRQGPQYSQARKASREVIYLPVSPNKTTEADCKLAFDVIKGYAKP